MPKAEPHFDVAGLCAQVHEQDIGLRVTTNNPGGFRRVVYKHMRAHPEHKLHIYSAPGSSNSFFLLKQKVEAHLGQETE